MVTGAMANPSPGDNLAGFILHEEIGEGGMGVVWSATQVSLGRLAAVKIVRDDLARDEQFLERFVSEARVAASLDNPNVVAVYDAGEVDGVLYMAMALVEGTDLRDLIASNGSLKPQDAVAVLDQAAAGLQAVHDAGLIHRDVKPANILVRSSDGKAMLTDFGLARAADASKATRTGMVVGTLDYIAPEQIEGGAIDQRVDIYSLGAVLYESLTGELPFKRSNAAAQMHAHLTEEPPRPSDHDPDLKPFDSVIAKAMAKNPAERPADALALSALAREALGEEPKLTRGFQDTVLESAAAIPVRPRSERRSSRSTLRKPVPAKGGQGETVMVASEAAPSRGRSGIVAAMALVACLAIAGLVIVALGGRGSESPKTTVEAKAETKPRTEPQTVTVERTVTTKPEPKPGPSDDWPGGSGYTTILASLGSQSEAVSEAAQATGRGLSAGVLYSSDYSSLRPGYWVVFSGSFQSESEASRRAIRAQSLGYSDAYPRFVSR